MKIRDEMPELEGATTWLNGEVTKHILIGDKPTFIHFWSVSCSLCKEAMPKINAVRDLYKDELNVIAVHLPRSEADLDVEQVKKVADRYHITQPIFIDHKHKLTDAFNNEYVPAYYIFDKNGKLRHYQAGGSGLKLLTKRLQRVINQ